ncbi:MAG TPA: sugar phosphate isomerase/epimerase [Clostridiales bacterium]|jgi:sugar phosphate isomerase/epimerase|nr:sugar phosphate isomerase/epimerase [Clostridiales bacterium]
MDVGVSTASFYPDALTEQTIPLIRDLGAKKIEVFLGSFSEYEEDYCSQLRDIIDGNGLSVYSVHVLGTQFEPQFFSLTERQRNDSRNLYLKVFKCANILGAKVYVFHGPPVRGSVKPSIDFNRIGPICDELAYLAGDHGLKFSWENVSWCWYSYPEFPDRLLEHTKSENIFFTFDIKQAMQTSHDPMDFLDRMGKRLINIHAIDYDDKKELTLPGRGIFDFYSLAQKLKTINYDGPIFLEVYRGNYEDYSDLKESMDFLREIFDS